MSPEELPTRPPTGRSPHMRRPVSVDGFYPGQPRRPIQFNAEGAQRPTMASPGRPAALPTRPPVSAPLPHLASNPVPQTSLPTVPAAEEHPPLAFTPPPAKKKPRRLLLRTGLAIALLALVGGGSFLYLRAQARQNDPVRAFDEALGISLSTTKLQTIATIADSKNQVSYDFTTLTDPIITNKATLRLAGAEFGVQAYGTAKNTYVSYQALPKFISQPVASAVLNGWVQVRAKGAQPAGVSSQIANLADPRYQAFGPVIVGNYPLKTRTQLINFLKAHKVYDYDTKAATTTTLDGHKVFAYPVKINTEYLKIAIQSAATSNKFTPADVQAAITALDALKETKATFYVTTKTHHFQKVELSKGDRRDAITYSQYGTAAATIVEPQTKLAWNDFSRLQWQMEAQAATRQPAAKRDALRQTRLSELHRALASYFAQNNSYPTSTSLNSQAWVAINLNKVDPENFRDPEAITLQIADTPKAGSFAYQPVSAAGKAGCDNSLANSCVHYKLTSILSTGKPLTLQDP